MKDNELEFNRECHVLYSKKSKKMIMHYISLHYPKEKCEEVLTKVQLQFVEYLKNFRTDLGGKKNFHNGIAGTYDIIFIFSYYKICKEVTSKEEIEKINTDLFMDSFSKLKFVDLNKKVYKKLMYKAFKMAKKRCDKWHDYEMEIEPYKDDEPIRYKFTTCPVAQFAKENDLLDILPILCNVDYVALETLHAKLIRTKTLGKDECCDYTICEDKDPYIKNHEEYIDENGGRFNR